MKYIQDLEQKVKKLKSEHERVSGDVKRMKMREQELIQKNLEFRQQLKSVRG